MDGPRHQPDGNAVGSHGRAGQHQGQHQRDAQTSSQSYSQRRAANPGQPVGAGRPRTSRRTVPTGLRLVAVTMGVVGGLLALSALLLLTGGSDAPGNVGTAIQFVGLVAGGLGGAHLLAAYGLWKITPWGRQGAIVLAVVNGLVSLATLLGGGSAGLLGLLLYGAITWYLHRSEALYRRLLTARPG